MAAQEPYAFPTLSPCFLHAFSMLSPRIQHAIPPHSTRFQYAFPSLRGPLVVGDDVRACCPNGFTGRARTPCAPRAPADVRTAGVHATSTGAQRSARPTLWPSGDLGNTPVRSPKLQPTPPTLWGSRVQALFTPCTSLVQAVYTLCTRHAHRMYTLCTGLVLALYWPCTSLRPHSKLRVQGSRFKVRGCAPPAIYHPPCSVAALPRWALCGQRRLCVALGCPCLEFNLQAVGDSGPVWMAFSADFGARGAGMGLGWPRRRHIGSAGAPQGIQGVSPERSFPLQNGKIHQNRPKSTNESYPIGERSVPQK